MSGPSVQPVLLCACLAAGLLFDPMGFLRMTLVCAFVHESGHVLAYMLCAHKLPGLHFSAGGIGLSGAEQLPRTQELWVLAAGRWRILSWRRCFFAASPAGELRTVFSRRRQFVYGRLQPDAVRRVRRRAPAAEFAAAEKQDTLRRAQRLLLCLFCAAALGFALLGGCRARSCGGFPGPGYLLAKEFRQK
jgi:hypothetical protein